MLTIYKYQFATDDFPSLYLPKNAKILKFDNQNETPTIWALIDPEEKEKVRRIFRLAGTGHPIQEHFNYIGTSFFLNGQLVLHLFEI